jgi:RNA polymerase sigma factor (sigma-70 family)
MTNAEGIPPSAERTPEQCQKLAEAGRRFALKAVSLFHKRHPGLFRLIGPEDALGTALLSIVRASHYFEPARGFEFSTYATRAALLDLMRTARQASLRRGRVVLFSTLTGEWDDFAFDPLDKGADPACQLADAEHTRGQVKALHAALAQLPKRLNYVVVHYHLKGWSLKAIGKHLGLCVERIRVLRGQAETRLRELLGAELRGPLPRQTGRRRENVPSP